MTYLPGLDEASTYFLQSLSSPTMDSVMQLISMLGSPVFWILVAAFIYWQGKKKESFYFMNLILVNLIVVGFLKGIFARPRPGNELAGVRVIETDYGYGTDYSFPSGHATLIASVFGFYLKAKKNLARLLALLMVLVMISRIYLGVHYLSDVLAGALLGMVLGVIAERLSEKKRVIKATKKTGLIELILVILFILMALFLVQPVYVTGIFAGFFAGFFLGVKQKIELKKASAKELLKRYSKALAGLLVFLTPLIYIQGLNVVMQFALMFLAGFWITYLFPLIEAKKKLF